MIDTTSQPQTGDGSGAPTPASVDSETGLDTSEAALEAPDNVGAPLAHTDPMVAWADSCVRWVRAKPLTALLAVFGLGLLLGRMGR